MKFYKGISFIYRRNIKNKYNNPPNLYSSFQPLSQTQDSHLQPNCLFILQICPLYSKPNVSISLTSTCFVCVLYLYQWLHLPCSFEVIPKFSHTLSTTHVLSLIMPGKCLLNRFSTFFISIAKAPVGLSLSLTWSTSTDIATHSLPTGFFLL